ncbi:MAG: hypothetical protein VX246_00645 [Myxococcota bacterium]|nr:hypothetical protein [Myxococcota bacterium]
MPAPNRPPSRFVFAALLVAGVIVIIEGMAVLTSGVLAQRGVLYEPTGLADYEAYLTKRDPVLGWPAPNSPQLDPSGARLAPDAGAPNCGAVYGDSFSFGSNVTDAAPYSNRLSERLGCRVANFAVAGYGTDQALMRYRSHEPGNTSFVVLAHLTENVMRNVNQYRALLYPTAKNGFKPRFVLDPRGSLEDVAIPSIAPADYSKFVSRPEEFLKHEYFAPGGASGTATRRFPHALALLRAFAHFHVVAELKGDIWYKDFYRPEHPSNALQLATEIFREFVREAAERGQQPVALILSTELDFIDHRQTGEWVHQPFLDALERAGIPYLDTSNAFESRMQGRSTSEFFSGAHPTEEGHHILADIVAAHLTTLGIEPTLREAKAETN